MTKNLSLKFLLIVIVFFGCNGYADEIVRPGDTAPVILSRAGVTAEWLWDFMEVNNLTLEDLHNLQVGDTMIIREEWKNALPDPSDEEHSKTMLAASKYKTIAAWNSAAAKENVKLKAENWVKDSRILELEGLLEKKEIELGNLRLAHSNEIDALNEAHREKITAVTLERDDLKTKLREAELKIAQLEAQKTPTWTLYAVALMVLLLGLEAARVWRLKKSNKSFPREYTDPSGVVWKLRDGGYECPWGCRELVPFDEHQKHGRVIHPERFQDVTINGEVTGARIKAI